MQRLKKIGKITAKSSLQVKNSKIGIGFEKLDRDLFDPEKAYDKVAQLGVKWVRIQSGWAKTEREKGKYDFVWLDKIVDNLIKRGLKPWICLCYGNGIYDENAAKIFGSVGVPPIFTAEQKEAWRNYVKALVTRYKDKVTHYEVWNEPDGDWCWKHGVNARELGLFTADTGKAIHEVFPQAEVIGLVQCLPDVQYIEEAFDGTGMAENINAVSFHEYNVFENYVPERVSALRAVTSVFKKDLKIIQGESGSQSRADGRGALHDKLWSEKAQVKQLTRHTLTDLMCGVEFTSYFSCMDMVEALNGSVDNKSSYLDYGYFGVLRADFDENGIAIGTYSQKPAYYALQTLCSVFADDCEYKSDMPVIFKPGYYNAYCQTDCGRHDLTFGFFERENGGQCLVYWKPENILTTDFTGCTSLQIFTKHGGLKLVDLCNGDVYELNDDMIEIQGKCMLLKHIPVKDTPLAIVTDGFCDWERI